MAIQYPAPPRIPNPVNPLEYALSGLQDGFRAGRQGAANFKGRQTLADIGARAGLFSGPLGGGGLDGTSLLALGGGSAGMIPGASIGGVPAAGTTTGGISTPSTALTGDAGTIYNDFIGTVRAGDQARGLAGVTNPYGLAAVASTGKAESGYSPGNIHREWSDPSESGKPGNAGGVLSWRAERLDNMRRFASSVGDDPRRPSAKTQALFFLSEDPSLVAKLNSAQSPEEAQAAINRAWAFAGWDRPGGEAARRTAMARSYASGFAREGGMPAAMEAINAIAPQASAGGPGGAQVASLEPGAGLPAEMPSALSYSPNRQPSTLAMNPDPKTPDSAMAGRRGGIPTPTARPSGAIATPTPRPQDQTYTMASATAPGGGSAGADPIMGMVQSVALGQTRGPTISEEEFLTLLQGEDTREIAMALFQSKVTGDPRAAERAIDLALRLDERSYDRQRQAAQDALLLDNRTYERGRDAAADARAVRQDERLDRQLDITERAATAKAGGFRQATPDEAKAYGASAGQFGPDGRFYPINPPSNSGGVTIGPDGTIQVGGGGGIKMPANFMPDPASPGGVKPIPGGPGEQLPSDLAGRIAIADSFLGQVDGIREKLANGAATGLWDRFQAGNNASSDQAAVYRQMQSGADALQRLLTGAGMTENEAAIYAGRYLPTYTDDAASAVKKLGQIQREIENARAAALRGRGGTSANVTPNGANTAPDPLGIR